MCLPPSPPHLPPISSRNPFLLTLIRYLSSPFSPLTILYLFIPLPVCTFLLNDVPFLTPSSLFPSGCPIDTICHRGCGSSLLTKPKKLIEVVAAMCANLPSRQVTVKIRTGWDDKNPMAHKLIPMLQKISKGRIAAVMIHGRSRLQRYSKLANWNYILETAYSQDDTLPTIPVIGNGDIFSWNDWKLHLEAVDTYSTSGSADVGITGSFCKCAMIGRGALIKPWLPREIKEQRVIDISATERLEMLKSFV